jgi:cytochrome c5
MVFVELPRSRRFEILRISAFPLAVALLSACGVTTGNAPGALSAHDVETARSRWSDASEASLERGHQTFLSSCDRCHGYPLLSAHSAADWPAIVKEMGDNAKLDAHASDELLRYILVARDAKVQSR